LKHEKTLPLDPDLEKLKILSEKSGLAWQAVVTATTIEERHKNFGKWFDLMTEEEDLSIKIQHKLLGKQEQS